MATKIIGILNCTPDSFSDSTGEVSVTALMNQARRMIDEGADILDIGGDSTRPGSICPGVEEEWRRIAPLVAKLAPLIPISVDTHHNEVARRAIECGASFINDVSGTRSHEMLQVVAQSSASYIFMCNPHGNAHTFGEGFSFGIALNQISSWIRETTSICVEAGIDETRLIADPGMGAFISADPLVSWMVAENFGTLSHPGGGLLLGCSRKGFLKVLGDLDIDAKDSCSAQIGANAVRQLPKDVPTYLRVHNVAKQRSALEERLVPFPDWRSCTAR